MSYPSGGVPQVDAGQLFASEINKIIDAFNALNPVGKYYYLCRSATTVATLVEEVLLECNAVSVLRADFPDLAELWAGEGWPFGYADATHMYLPDAQGRSLVSMASGGHTDVNGLGDSDGLAKASRSPKHNTSAVSVSGSASGASAGTPAGTVSAHSHGTHDRQTQSMTPGSTPYSTNGSEAGPNTDLATPTFTGTPMGNHSHSVSASGTGGPGGTRPNDLAPWLVGGTLFIKAFA